MSRIDHSIYSQFQPADIFGSVQKGMQMRDQMDERARKQAELEKQKGIDAAYKAGVTQNPDGTLSYDNQKTTAALLGWDPREAMKFQQDQAARDAQALEQRQKKNAFEAEHVARELEGVKDQASYAAAGDRLKAAGVDMNGWDPVYSPDRVARAKYGATTYAQRLAQQNADRNFKLEEKRLQSAAADRAEARAARTQEKELVRAEKEYELATPYGKANTRDDAKQLKEGHESKLAFDAKLGELIDLRKKYGVEYMNREAVARGKQLSKDLLLEYKNMAKLGVLSKSDEDIINAIIPDDPLGQDYALGQDPILNNLEKFQADKNRDFENRIATRVRPGQRTDRQAPLQGEWNSSAGKMPAQKTLKTSDIEWED